MKFKFILRFSTILVLIANSLAWAGEMRPAPSCQLSSLGQDRHYDLGDYKGKVVYVDFWASWCGPCIQSFPFMNKLENELKDKGLAVVGINLDEELGDAKAFVAEHPVNFTIATDPDQQCAKQFQVRAMPSSYLIDRNGMIREVHLGFRPGEAEKFRTVVEQVLNEPAVTH